MSLADEYMPEGVHWDEFDTDGLQQALKNHFTVGVSFEGIDQPSFDAYKDAATKQISEGYEAREKNVLDGLVRLAEASGSPITDEVATERWRFFEQEQYLRAIDTLWKHHLKIMESLKEGIRTGSCLEPCHRLRGLIELEETAVSKLPIRWTFSNADHGLSHPWEYQDKGAIRVQSRDEAPNPALIWRTVVEERTLALGETVPVPAVAPGETLWVELEFEDTLAGRLGTTLLKTPPVHLLCRDSYDVRRRFRIVPGITPSRPSGWRRRTRKRGTSSRMSSRIDLRTQSSPKNTRGRLPRLGSWSFRVSTDWRKSATRVSSQSRWPSSTGELVAAASTGAVIACAVL